MTYSSGIKTANHTNATTADNFHLMRGRVDVDGYRGYYIIHPESYTATPPVLVANTNGKTASGTFNIAKSATTQRWLILTADEALQFDNGNILAALNDLSDLMAQIRQLTKIPHSEDVEEADATLTTALSDIESQAAACTKGSEIAALTDQARAAAVEFLSSVTATDETQPFDLTFMIENPDFDSDVTAGWTTTNVAPGYDAQAAEFYEKTFNFYQTLQDMPSGKYELHANAFQRPGTYDTVLTPFLNGNAKVTTSLYINNTARAVKHICEDRQAKYVFNDGGWGSDSQLSDGSYIPNCMVGAAKYFAKGLYDSSVDAQLKTKGGNLRIGIKCTSTNSAYWTMFDSFRLYFFGGGQAAVGISVLEEGTEDASHGHLIYDLQGRRIGTLPKKGLYIIDGKKVIISQ